MQFSLRCQHVEFVEKSCPGSLYNLFYQNNARFLVKSMLISMPSYKMGKLTDTFVSDDASLAFYNFDIWIRFQNCLIAFRHAHHVVSCIVP